MNMHNYLERAERALAPWLDRATRPEAHRLDLAIGPDDLLPAVSALAQDEWGYLAAITGLDPGIETGELWALYHFAEGAAVVTLRVILPREKPEVSTIRGIAPLAAVYEQELHEMLGVTVTGTPPAGRLFLADDWPAGVYPLRKDFQGF
jgi:Ni,Fe-hydrogenase III component G